MGFLVLCPQVPLHVVRARGVGLALGHGTVKQQHHTLVFPFPVPKQARVAGKFPGAARRDKADVHLLLALETKRIFRNTAGVAALLLRGEGRFFVVLDRGRGVAGDKLLLRVQLPFFKIHLK